MKISSFGRMAAMKRIYETHFPDIEAGQKGLLATKSQARKNDTKTSL